MLTKNDVSIRVKKFILDASKVGLPKDNATAIAIKKLK
jgi:hypothetical protein